MQISKIQYQTNLYQNLNSQAPQKNVKHDAIQCANNSNPYKQIPLYYQYDAKISFSGKVKDPNKYQQRGVPDIDYDYYMSMSPNKKKLFRRLYFDKFEKRKYTSKLFNPQNVTLPLKNERTMDEFIKVAKMYAAFKDQPILCLGRSPKWFLDAAKWMKNGIDDYNFIAFSGYWFYPHPVDGVRLIEGAQPTAEETAAYRRYLVSKQADPASLVKTFNETGKKTVLTDYIDTGKGVSSFLDLMAKFAKDQGVIHEFPDAFQIMTIGSISYREERLNLSDDAPIETPEVRMPPSLAPYAKRKTPSLFHTYRIPQEFHDINYSLFMEMLINENTTECRSSYYPHSAWPIYRPDRFRTGFIRDMSKVKKLLEHKDLTQKSVADFSLPMADFRNLLNFRILDALNARELLKVIR